MTRHDSSRREFLKVAGTATVGLLGAAGSAAAGSRSRSAAAQEVPPQQFVGSATTTVNYLDEGGQLIESRTYENDVFVIIGSAEALVSQQETNPFHLEILPQAPLLPSTDTVEGDFPQGEGEYTVYSAYNFGDRLLQYWDLSLTAGNAFTGELTDPHVEESRVWNYLNAWTPGQEVTSPLPLSEGSLAEGVIEGNQLELGLRGNTVEERTPFESTITATSP